MWAADDAKYTSGTNAPPAESAATGDGSPGRSTADPATVTFDKAKPELEKLSGRHSPFSGKATTTAKFSEPGDYVLHVTANDFLGRRRRRRGVLLDDRDGESVGYTLAIATKTRKHETVRYGITFMVSCFRGSARPFRRVLSGELHGRGSTTTMLIAIDERPSLRY